MTTRIYYTEPYRKDFDATVVESREVDGRVHVLLDQTAFYPTSGGQPFDTGTIGGASVIEVMDRDDGEVVHIVSGQLKPGAVVHGSIDWARRFDHMQQHTGQHVLSAAFDRLFAARTESFHLGETAATIDLGKPVTPEQIAAAEAESNRIVWEDRPVTIRFATAEEAAAMPLRKESGRTGSLRLIDIEDFDLSACGGTHVARAGGIGIIAVSKWEKFRNGTRVEFVCGGRALARFREWRSALADIQKNLSVSPQEMSDAVVRLQDEGKTLQRALRGVQERLAGYEAAGLIAKGQRSGDRLVIAEALDGWDAQSLKTMAVAAAALDPGAAIALFTTTSPALVVIARGANSTIDAGAILRNLSAKFGGKGGGKPDLAQGGGLTAPSADLIATVRGFLNS